MKQILLRRSGRKIRSILLLLFLFLTSLSFLNAQVTVTGTVTGADDGVPMPGVNIIEKGKTNGATHGDGQRSAPESGGEFEIT